MCLVSESKKFKDLFFIFQTVVIINSKVIFLLRPVIISRLSKFMAIYLMSRNNMIKIVSFQFLTSIGNLALKIYSCNFASFNRTQPFHSAKN